MSPHTDDFEFSDPDIGFYRDRKLGIALAIDGKRVDPKKLQDALKAAHQAEFSHEWLVEQVVVDVAKVVLTMIEPTDR